MSIYLLPRPRPPTCFLPVSLSLSLTQPDTISALWVAADLDSRDGTTFVDVVDFCFNCVLFMEREKEARNKETIVFACPSIRRCGYSIITIIIIIIIIILWRWCLRLGAFRSSRLSSRSVCSTPKHYDLMLVQELDF